MYSSITGVAPSSESHQLDRLAQGSTGFPPSSCQRVQLLVGAEGGLDPQEILAAGQVGFQAVGLGPRILRTETAGLAALAAMQALWGDFRGRSAHV